MRDAEFFQQMFPVTVLREKVSQVPLKRSGKQSLDCSGIQPLESLTQIYTFHQGESSGPKGRLDPICKLSGHKVIKHGCLDDRIPNIR